MTWLVLLCAATTTITTTTATTTTTTTNQHSPIIQAVPVAFVAIDSSSNDQYYEYRTSGNQTSYMNTKEAHAVVDTLEGFLRHGNLHAKDIGE